MKKTTNMKVNQPKIPALIPVGISSCLLGEHVRYDGGHKFNHDLVKMLEQHFEFQSFCPEVSIGLGVPREPIRLIMSDETLQCVGTRTVKLNVTTQLSQCAQNQKYWLQSIYGYILKKGSPSCGIKTTKIYQDRHSDNIIDYEGTGIYAAKIQVLFPELPVEHEQRLETQEEREGFIKRVIDYKKWRDSKLPV